MIAVISISTIVYVTQNRALEAIDQTAVQDYPECAMDAFTKAQEKMPVKIRTPTYLPDGYKLVAVDIVSGEGGWVSLYYWNKDSCPSTDLNDLIVNEGLINVGLYLSDGHRYENGEKFVDDMLRYFENEGSIADIQVITLSNGYKGIGFEPFIGVNKVIDIKYINGTEVEEVVESKPLPMPGIVQFIHEEDNVMYIVLANLPLDELKKIAESIQ